MDYQRLSLLLGRLHRAPSAFDRLIGRDDRLIAIRTIALEFDYRAVPYIAVFLAGQDALSAEVGAVIPRLAGSLDPARLAWLDSTVRTERSYQSPESWWSLKPEAVPGLIAAHRDDVTIAGVVASHHNGFVRASALESLADQHDGREIPFLTLRSNDWVEQVAHRATELLQRRLRPENVAPVLKHLPHLLRMLGQQRRSHAFTRKALRTVLLSATEATLATADLLSAGDRFRLFDVLLDGDPAESAQVFRHAVREPHVATRARALRGLPSAIPASESVVILVEALRSEPMGWVRRNMLEALAELGRPHLEAIYPAVLLDRSRSVRELARHFIERYELSWMPRLVYLEHLDAARQRQVAAIHGLGETGLLTDVGRLAALAADSAPASRRAALRALASLDSASAVAAAATALFDATPSVRSTAAKLLARHQASVDFPTIAARLPAMAADARQTMLWLLSHAPKWDALEALLGSLSDPDPGVHDQAMRLIGRWNANFNRRQQSLSVAKQARLNELLLEAAPHLSPDMLRLVQLSVGRPS